MQSIELLAQQKNGNDIERTYVGRQTVVCGCLLSSGTREKVTNENKLAICAGFLVILVVINLLGLGC